MSLRREIAEVLETDQGKAAAPPGPHPDVEELLAYRSGTLGGEEAESLQEHLSRCRPCAEDLLDLESFVEAGRRWEGKTPGSVPDLGAAATWKGLRSGRHLSRIPRRSLAAALVAVTVGVGWWGLQQRATVEELRRATARSAAPVADAPIFDLSASSVRGGEGPPPSLLLPEEAAIVTLVLHLPDAAGLDRVEVGLEDPRGEEVWSAPLRVSEFGTLRLGLHRSYLREGVYRLEVFTADAAEGGERRSLSVFSFTVALATSKS